MRIQELLDLLKRLNQIFNKKDKRRFFLILMLIVAMSLFQAIGVAAVFPFISLVIDPSMVLENQHLKWLYDALGFQNVRSFAIAFGFMVVGLIVLGNAVCVLGVWLKSRFVCTKNHELSRVMLQKYMFAPYLYFVTHNTADLGKNILVEVGTLTNYLMMPLLELLTDIVLVLFIFTTLILVSPVAAGSVFFIFCVFYGITYKIGLRNKTKTKGGERFKANAERYKAVSEALGGIKDIKVMGRERFFLERFEDHSRSLAELQVWHLITQRTPRYLIEAVAFGGAVIFILILMFLERDLQQLIPLVGFFAFAGVKLMPLFNKIFESFMRLRFNKVVLDKIHEDIKSGKDEAGLLPDDDTLCAERIEFKDEIRFRELCFSYPISKRPVFRDLDLVIKKNTSVAIAGSTGSGKTTLADILLGLLRPSRGGMEVDGIPITQERVRAWQRNIGYVPQHIYLSDDTIKRNIAFGVKDEEIIPERVEQVAKIADLHGLITGELPDGYETVIGERGIRLSGGQRQRVGIARALYSDPDILVLDEATSSLDGVTERDVHQAIDNVSKLKTVVIIAHRLTTVRQCDVVYLLDKGRVADQGTYEELMEKNAQFRAMAGGSKYHGDTHIC